MSLLSSVKNVVKEKYIEQIKLLSCHTVIVYFDLGTLR